MKYRVLSAPVVIVSALIIFQLSAGAEVLTNPLDVPAVGVWLVFEPEVAVLSCDFPAEAAREHGGMSYVLSGIAVPPGGVLEIRWEPTSCMVVAQQWFSDSSYQDAERVVVPSAKFGGYTSQLSYTGLVDVLVSGTVKPVPEPTWGRIWWEDAFYVFSIDDPSNHKEAPYGLAVAFDGCACRSECGGIPLLEYTPNVPPFSENHHYTVRIYTGEAPTRLTFGCADCGNWDNVGTYLVTILRSEGIWD